MTSQIAQTKFSVCARQLPIYPLPPPDNESLHQTKIYLCINCASPSENAIKKIRNNFI